MKHFENELRFCAAGLARYARPLALTACFLAVLGLAGCASWITREAHVTLRHTQHQVTPIPAAENMTVGVRVNDKRDYLAPGISRKWGKAVVGYGRNGLGETTYPDIVVTEPVAMTIKQSIESELTARGFRVADNAKLQVVVDVNVFFNDYKAGILRSDAVADLKMNVSVLLNGDSRYSRQVAAQGHVAWANTMGSQDAETALNAALDNGMDALFGDGAFVSALLIRKQAEGTR